MAWFRDEAVVARMQELIEGYITDRTSKDVLQELAGLRRVLAQLWLDEVVVVVMVSQSG